MKNLAVFVSGSGTNLRNIAEKIKTGELKNCKISLVVSSKEKVGALGHAKKYGLKTFISHKRTPAEKLYFETEILKQLIENKIDYIILAGYMRILSKTFIQQLKERIINIHPAFLPNFPGAHAIQDAWRANILETGVTVHFVDEGVDTGPIILQKKVRRTSSDTLESLEQKIHEVEYALYPRAIQLLVDDRLSIVKNKVLLDGKPLTTLVQ